MPVPFNTLIRVRKTAKSLAMIICSTEDARTVSMERENNGWTYCSYLNTLLEILTLYQSTGK